MQKQINTILKSEDLKDISISMVEKVLDNQIEDEILQKVPVIKSLIAAKKIYNTYSDAIFLKKAMHVLLEIGEVNWKERIDLTNELNDENGSGAEKILLAIDKLETIEKCKVYGRLCRLKALDKIYTDDFLRLTKVIQDAYLDDLWMIKHFNKRDNKQIHELDYLPLITLGLLYRDPSEQEEIRKNHMQMDEHEPEFLGGGIEFNYFLSHEGNLLAEHYDDLFPNEDKN